jgi:FAD/FMN-containing dehydrogenase
MGINTTKGINRRRFLAAAGLGATGAALTACTGRSPAPPAAPTTTPPVTSAPATTTPAADSIDYPALRAKLAGQLVTPDQPGYSTARRSYNPLFDDRRPGAVAQVSSVSDVQACVSAAAGTHTPIAARGGGHSYLGASTPDNALVVDLGRLSAISPQPDGSVVVGAGTRLIDLYAALAAAGRCLPGGSCPSVGVAGLTLGGGIGVLARRYGLTCDQLTSATVVTADGTVRTASPGSEPDLYWALRGGGGGNLGIVTSFTFSTAPAPSPTVFSLRFPAGSVGQVLGEWQHWLAGAPDELWSNCTVTVGSPPTCRVGGCFLGSPAGLAPLLTSLAGRAGVQPVSKYSKQMSYLDAMRYFAGCAGDSVAQCHLSSAGGALGRESFVASSRVLAAPVTDLTPVVRACTGPAGMSVIFDGLGGAVGRVAADATAFPHRSALATVQIYLDTTAAAQAASTAQVTSVRDELAAVLGPGAYVNYLDRTTPRQDYYLGNLARLTQVADRYDPTAVFSTLGR